MAPPTALLRPRADSRNCRICLEVDRTGMKTATPGGREGGREGGRKGGDSNTRNNTLHAPPLPHMYAPAETTCTHGLNGHRAARDGELIAESTAPTLPAGNRPSPSLSPGRERFPPSPGRAAEPAPAPSSACPSQLPPPFSPPPPPPSLCMCTCIPDEVGVEVHLLDGGSQLKHLQACEERGG